MPNYISERELYPNELILSRILGVKSEILFYLLPLKKEASNLINQIFSNYLSQEAIIFTI